jgi:hypothetical protein
MINVLTLALMACSGGCSDTGETAMDSGTTDPGPGFSLMADTLESGMLLSSWSDGDVLLSVGGDLGSGPGTLTRYEGGVTCIEKEVHDRGLWWIHGPRAGEWYAVGFAGRILHSVDGVRTTEDVDTEATLYGVWAEQDGTAWTVGWDLATNGGEVWKKTGEVWEKHSAGLPGALFKVWDGWIVGDDQIYQIVDDVLVSHDTVWLLDDDDNLYEETVAADLSRDWDGVRLLTVRGRNNTDDVWVVGGDYSSLLLHFDGDRWEEVSTAGVGQPLNGVWTATGEDIWVAGHFGTTAVYSTESQTWLQPSFPVTNQHFHGVRKHKEEVIWVGGNLFSAGNNIGTMARYGENSSLLTATDCE